jgi:diguanylate cyclase (GGDEF)-like protein/PAS domain S-box-containing protein
MFETLSTAKNMPTKSRALPAWFPRIGRGRMLSSIANYSHENPLGRRVLAAILLCSTCLAFLATGLQLLFDYRHDVSIIEARMLEIEKSYLDSIGASMWSMDDQQTRKQLEGLGNLPDVVFVQLRDAEGKTLVQIGAPVQSHTITRKMPVKFLVDAATKQTSELGTLTVIASLDRVYSDLRNKALVILVAQTTKTTIVAIFTLFIFAHLVSRHLSTLAGYARGLDISNLGAPLKLSRKSPPRPDELDVVVSAINEMAGSIKHDFDELSRYRAGLEELVDSRTAELAQKVTEKEEVISELNREIKEREAAEQTVRDNEERYRQLVEMSPDAIMIESDGKIVFVNSGTLRLLGATHPDQLLGMAMMDFVPQEWQEMAHDHMQRLLAHDKELRPFEAKIVRFDSSTVDVEVSRSVFQYQGLPAIQTVAHDITKHKHYEEQLRKQALHDGLTGLPNRSLLMDRLAQAIATAERQKHSIYVLFFDLDRFKYINDTLGHDAGDELLKTITARMSECVRKCDTLARLGGDEFVLLLGNIHSEDAVQRLTERIMEKISEPMILGNQEITITSSIGLSAYPKDGSDAMALLKYADTAMYRAKELGRNGFQRYSEEMHTRVNEHLVMESRLRRALEREELLLHYQPLLDLKTGKIIGAEALIRWQHPELGLVPPARFIPLAEETGLITSIGEWVTRTACAQAKAWQDAGLPPVRIAVNLSAQQLVRPDLESEVQLALAETGLDAKYLELEITESMSMNDPERMVALLLKFKAMGVGVSIDDFGTGYSNLAYLKRFPVDRLKLDRSFVRDITNDPQDAGLAEAIISLAHSMHLTVVAEGVEELGQLSQLLDYGCDEMQGYYFSAPVPADAFGRMLQSGRTLHVPAKAA